MDLVDYLDKQNYNHKMITDKKHIFLLCNYLANKNFNVVEFGSYSGISTAALAIASKDSKIISVDLSDHISEQYRIKYWNSLNITNITPITCSTSQFLLLNKELGSYYDFIFHDAIHGIEAFNEYLDCIEMADNIAIHDFEQLPFENKQCIKDFFYETIEDVDSSGRCLFMGLRKKTHEKTRII
jgi:predicted O-methyltransferase YrrM